MQQNLERGRIKTELKNYDLQCILDNKVEEVKLIKEVSQMSMKEDQKVASKSETQPMA